MYQVNTKKMNRKKSFIKHDGKLGSRFFLTSTTRACMCCVLKWTFCADGSFIIIRLAFLDVSRLYSRWRSNQYKAIFPFFSFHFLSPPTYTHRVDGNWSFFTTCCQLTSLKCHADGMLKSLIFTMLWYIICLMEIWKWKPRHTHTHTHTHTFMQIYLDRTNNKWYLRSLRNPIIIHHQS